MSEIKSANEILSENIPDEIKKEGFNYGDVHPVWIERAMKKFAEQFIDLANQKGYEIATDLSNDGDWDMDQPSILSIKDLIK